MKREKLMQLLAGTPAPASADVNIRMCAVTESGRLTDPMTRSEAFALGRELGYDEEFVHLGEDMYGVVCKITPAISRNVLIRLNPDNRELIERHGQCLQSDMIHGYWVLTHEAIGHRRDGKCQDGQHRYWAVYQSGLTIKCLVILNVSDRARQVIDSGKGRTATDYIRMESGDDHVGRLIESTAVRMYAGLGHKTPNLSHSDKVALIHKYRPAIDWAMQQFPPRVKNVTNAAVVSAVARAVHHVPSLERLAKFCRVVRDLLPSGEPADKTALNLGTQLRTASANSRMRRSVWYRYGVVCKAISAFMAGEILDGDIKPPQKREIYTLPTDPAPIYQRLFQTDGQPPAATA